MENNEIITRLVAQDETTPVLKKVDRQLGSTVRSLSNLGSASRNTAGALDESASASKRQAGGADQAASSTDRAANAQKNWFAHITRTTIQSALVNKAFLTVADSIGKAAKQTDIIETFPAAMASMGVSSNVASDALSKLRVYVQNVGGDLAAATNAVSRFVQVNKDVKASTAVYAGVNNALMAGGTSAETQASALEQLIQAYSRGKFEGEEWRSVNTAMSLAISKTAEALGYVNTSALQKALTDGAVSMNQFITELTKISTEAGPIAEQAMLRMNGIEFAQMAMKNALVNGLNEIYAAVGRQNIVAFFTFLTDVIRVLFTWIVALINAFRGLIGFITGKKLEPITGDTQEALQNSAGSAGKIGKNLDDAGKSAKKLHNQLAAFDKMNVLQEPTTSDGGKKKKGGAGNGGFDPGQTSALDNIFGKMAGSLKEASLWAKILAGIIAALAVNKLFGGKPLDMLIKGLDTATRKMFGLDRAAKQAGVSAGKSLGQKIGEGVKSGISGVGSFLGSALGSSLAKLSPAFTGLGSTISETFSSLVATTGGSAAAAVGVIVLAVASAVGEFLLLRDYWKEVVKFLEDIWKGFCDILEKASRPAVNAVKKIWGELSKALKPAIDSMKKAWSEIAKAIKPFTDELSKLWNTYIAPFVKTIGDWIEKNGLLVAGLKILGAIFTGMLAAAFASVLVPIGLVVVLLAGIASTIAIVVSAIVDFVSKAIAVFMDLWNAITTGVSNAWNTAVAIISGIPSWFNNNIVVPVAAFLVGLWNTLIAGVKNTWDTIVRTIVTIPSWINTFIVVPTIGFFLAMWNGIVGIFQGAGRWFGDIFRGAWNAITGVFSGVGGFFRWVWGTIVSIFTGVGTSIGNAIGGSVKGVVNSILGFAENNINGFIRAINAAVDTINRIPGVHIGRLGLLNIPRLATGGIISQPTVAMVGEAGAEAVMPLENNTQWIDKLASKLDRGSSRPSDNGLEVTNQQDQKPIHITINVSGVFATSNAEKRKVAEEIADQLKDLFKARGIKGVL
jgi:tape measure domain-containing protein